MTRSLPDTTSKDGTVKLWDLAAGKEIATLISIGAQDWAVTTPSGLYDASPGAMKLMHYVVGMDVVTLRQIKERYWEPGQSATSKAMFFEQNIPTSARIVVKTVERMSAVG